MIVSFIISFLFLRYWYQRHVYHHVRACADNRTRAECGGEDGPHPED